MTSKLTIAHAHVPTEEPAERRDNNFLQTPFVQNVLPLITSLSVHAFILIFGLLVFGAVKLVHMPATERELIIPTSEWVESGQPGGILHQGPPMDPLRESTQPNDPTPTATGFTQNKSLHNEMADAGEPGEASMIGVGPMTGFGPKGGLPGHGSDLGGPQTMIGPAGGGGGLGPKGPMFGSGGNAHLIVFLCDATGSMINKMPTLKDELNQTVVKLHPNQSFDIVFYQGVKIEQLATTLIAANPENKRKAGTYLEGITATDTTDPVPSLIAALKLKPQLMYFLTDAADFPDTEALLAAIKKYNPKNETKINTILFVENKAEHERNADSEGLMKKIAAESGGTFRWVEMDELP